MVASLWVFKPIFLYHKQWRNAQKQFLSMVDLPKELIYVNNSCTLKSY